MRIWISAIILAMVVAACGSSPPPEEKKPPPPPQETVFDDMLQTQDKAKEAGAKVENRVNDLNQKLDAEEKGDTPPE